MTITGFNPETGELEQTVLNAPTAEGATSLPVKNNQNFTGTNQRALLGKMGTESAEIVTVSGVSGNDTITVSATKFAHAVDTPIYLLKFDKIRFYRSTTGVDGTKSLLDTVDLDVDNEEGKTYYDDTTGSNSYYYWVTVYHSLAMVESEYSDPIQGSGFPRKAAGRIIDELYEELGIEAAQVTERSLFLAWMNEVNDDLHTHFQRPPSCVWVREAFAMTAESNTIPYPTFDDDTPKMWKFDKLVYNYTDDDSTPAVDESRPIYVRGLDEFQYDHQDNTEDDSDILTDIALDDAMQVIRYRPATETSAPTKFYIYYWKYFSEFTSEADEVETPGTKIYKDYCRGKYYRRLAKRESSYHAVADRFMSDYTLDKASLQRHNRRDAGSTRSFGMRAGRRLHGYRR